MTEHGRGLRLLALADQRRAGDRGAGRARRSRPSTATTPTGSRRARRRAGAACWCDGASAARARTSRRRRSTSGRGCTSMAAAPMRAATTSWSRSTSPTSGSSACRSTARRRARSRRRAAAALRYADLTLDAAGSQVFAVREDHRGGGEPVNTHRRGCGLDRTDDAGQVLAAGHDFFSSPRLSPDRRRLAWLSWDHPDMPWDATDAVAGRDRRERGARRAAQGRGRGRRGDRPAGLVARRAALLRLGPDRLVEPPSARRRAARCLSARCLPNLPGRPGPSAAAGTRFLGAERAPGLLFAGGPLASARIEVASGRQTQNRSAATASWAGSAAPPAARCCAPGRPTARRRSSCSTGERRGRASSCSSGALPVDPAWLARPRGGRVSERAEARAPMRSTTRRPIRIRARRRASARR